MALIPCSLPFPFCHYIIYYPAAAVSESVIAAQSDAAAFVYYAANRRRQLRSFAVCALAVSGDWDLASPDKRIRFGYYLEEVLVSCQDLPEFPVSLP